MMTAEAGTKRPVALVTGGTKGIGFGLAREFAAQGCAVTIVGRKAADVELAATEIAAAAGVEPELVLGIAGDVTRIADLDKAWTQTTKRFGAIDHWVNNAGIRHRLAGFVELEPSEVETTLQANLAGTFNGSAVAARGMLDQGSGAIWNMEGLGSDGKHMPGASIYSTTKRAILYFSDSLSRELRDTGVLVGTISPGIVFTNMILANPGDGPDNPEWKKSVRTFRMIGQPEETVSPFLVKRMLGARRSGAHIRWLTPLRAVTTIVRRTVRPLTLPTIAPPSD